MFKWKSFGWFWNLILMILWNLWVVIKVVFVFCWVNRVLVFFVVFKCKLIGGSCELRGSEMILCIVKIGVGFWVLSL